MTPKGWKLVPEEPTDAMIAAFRRANGWRSAFSNAFAAAPSPPDPWSRDMEAAPKDGTELLAFSPAYNDDGGHHPAQQAIVVWDADNGNWPAKVGGWFEPDELTAWMPLPPPPEDKP